SRRRLADVARRGRRSERAEHQRACFSLVWPPRTTVSRFLSNGRCGSSRQVENAAARAVGAGVPLDRPITLGAALGTSSRVSRPITCSEERTVTTYSIKLADHTDSPSEITRAIQNELAGFYHRVFDNTSHSATVGWGRPSSEDTIVLRFVNDVSSSY